MPRQSKAQKKTMERVMHEYKHGDLESGSGKKVKSRQQAIAIGLKEAGASKYASQSENKRNLAHTNQKARQGKTGTSRKRKGAK